MTSLLTLPDPGIHPDPYLLNIKCSARWMSAVNHLEFKQK